MNTRGFGLPPANFLTPLPPGALAIKPQGSWWSVECPSAPVYSNININNFISGFFAGRGDLFIQLVHACYW